VFTPYSDPFEWLAGHLQVSLAGPAVIQRYVPLELAVSVEGPFERTLPMEDFGPSYVDWMRAFSTAEVLRVYLPAHGDNAAKVDPVEFGLGLGYHQLWPYVYAYDHLRSRYGYELQHLRSQWRGHIFLRFNFLPTHSSGPLVEWEWQHALDNHKISGGDPSGAVLAKLGWRFRV